MRKKDRKKEINKEKGLKDCVKLRGNRKNEIR